MNESAIIERFFAPLGGDDWARPGDDCALLTPPEGKQLVLSMDTSLIGVHFPADCAAEDTGWRCLAVALSDLAACGADADFCLISLSIPSVDTAWLSGFTQGLHQCLTRYNVRLVGGDLTCGSLAISVQVGGWIDNGYFLPRSGAQAGDIIGVTGVLGKAAIGLQLSQTNSLPLTASQKTDCLNAYLRPEPQLRTGKLLSSLANSCIDLSDGLAKDLSLICQASGTGADLHSARIPCYRFGDRETALTRAMDAGDDYELCFSVAPEKLTKLQIDWHNIGTISAMPGLRLDGTTYTGCGWDAFKQ